MTATVLTCGHRIVYAVPKPKPGDRVYCLRCEGASVVSRRKDKAA